VGVVVADVADGEALPVAVALTKAELDGDALGDAVGSEITGGLSASAGRQAVCSK